MLEAVITGAAAALIGMASGQALVLAAGRRRLALRLSGLESQIEQTIPNLITRAEVQQAFEKAAQIEAQRQVATIQQARAAAVFGAGAPAAAPAAVAQRPDMNMAINSQLEALNDRINRINQEFGVR